MDTQIAGKVDKVPGKGLSANDYTTEEKNKLSGAASLDSPVFTGIPQAPTPDTVSYTHLTFQQKLDQGELKGDKGDSFKVGESYETATEKTFFFKLMS